MPTVIHLSFYREETHIGGIMPKVLLLHYLHLHLHHRPRLRIRMVGICWVTSQHSILLYSSPWQELESILSSSPFLLCPSRY